MRCLIDSNVLISASLFPTSVPARAFMAAATFPNDAVICDYSIDEMRRVYNRKFPHKIPLLEEFLAMALISAEIVTTPPEDESIFDEAFIRDTDDRPILRAAVASDAEVLITGDRDFLESGLTRPAILTPADFLAFW